MWCIMGVFFLVICVLLRTCCVLMCHIRQILSSFCEPLKKTNNYPQFQGNGNKSRIAELYLSASSREVTFTFNQLKGNLMFVYMGAVCCNNNCIYSAIHISSIHGYCAVPRVWRSDWMYIYLLKKQDGSVLEIFFVKKQMPLFA